MYDGFEQHPSNDHWRATSYHLPFTVAELNQVFDIGDEADLGIPRTCIEAAAYKGNYEVFVMLHEVDAFFGNSLHVVLNSGHEQRYVASSAKSKEQAKKQEIRRRFIEYIEANEHGECEQANLHFPNDRTERMTISPSKKAKVKGATLLFSERENHTSTE